MSAALDSAKLAFEASKKLMLFSEKNRQDCLHAIADSLLKKCEPILEANAKDLAAFETKEAAFYDRLKLSKHSIEQMANACIDIAKQEQVVNCIESEFQHSNSLIIQKQKLPIGVILCIFESRPNVVIDASALAIKSGNAILLKGGKEAKFSNEILFQIVQEACSKYLVPHAVVLVENREAVSELLKAREYIQLVVPRGGEKLVQYVMQESRIPVVAHAKGLCHIFIDESAAKDTSIAILENAKLQRPGVCNAVETLLVHKNWDKQFLTDLFRSLSSKGCELRLCNLLYAQFPEYKLAQDIDWETEYLDKILSVKQVGSIQEAIAHIQKYSSQHTEAILSQSQANIELFTASLDSSCIVSNASTRFNDGGQLGLGAELGISTTKLHAYGPMGAKEMTIARFLVKGQGQIRK